MKFLINNQSARLAINDLKARADKKHKKIKDLSIPLRQGSIFLDRWAQRNFKTEGGNVGGWEPFARGGRILRDGSIDSSAKLLQDTGRLRASVLPFANARDAGVASDLPYSKIHHQGIGVPERRILPKRSEVIDKLRQIFKLFLGKAID